MSIPGTNLPRCSALLALAFGVGACTSQITDEPALEDEGTFAVNGLVPGDALPGATEEQLALFEVGLEDFSEEEDPDEGLGPVFNDLGCGTCHDQAATGGGSATDIKEARFGFTDRRGNFDPLVEFGGSLQQLKGIGPVEIVGCEGVVFEQETIPDVANTVAERLTQPLFGIGLVNAVPDITLFLLEQQQQELTPDTAGRVSIVTGVTTGQTSVGRFGWKAQVTSLADFAGDAYLNEMGITNPIFPTDSAFNGDPIVTFFCDPAVDDDPEDDGTALVNFENFMSMLAPVPTAPAGGQATVGASVFAGIGCAACHQPTLTTGLNPIAALDQKTFAPFSDFLLHDMGSLGDGIVQESTQGAEMRTQPLWGARFRTAFLHDGRALTVEDAILAHAGQGRDAARAFRRLPRFFRQAVVEFVLTL